MPYLLSCHCGHVRLEVDAELEEVVDCNCSICVRTGFLHWYIKPEQMKLLTQKIVMHTYWWRSATGGQHFCPTCGMAVVRTSIEYEPYLSVNARCIEDVDVTTLKIRQFDGKHAYP